jgi:BirA family biotin operon repressor/biotin-[acetyl-CoA-carboxylase] ligase
VEPENVLSLLPEGLESWEVLVKRTGLEPTELREALLVLQGQGFPVVISEEGAGLVLGTPAPQILIPLLRGKYGRAYRYFGVVTSTQDLLRAWKDAPIGAVVLAESQTQGRGRRGRNWESPQGNLYFSVLLENTRDPLLPLRAGLALAEATQVGLLKWPNDLLAPDGRKLGGVLIEAENERAFLGVGLNVRVAPLPNSAALEEFRQVHRAQLLADFLWSLEKWLAKENETVLAAWSERNMTLGRKVVVWTGKEIIVGMAISLGSKGELLIRTEKGIRAVAAGDVSLLRMADDVKDAEVGEGEAERGSSGHSQSKGPRPSRKQG